MNFHDYIEENRKGINDKIMEYLPLKEPKEHYKMVREYSERQGKYIRPGLLMLCGEMFGAKKADLLLPAAAMQLSEDWILIHDDLEDDSELRRGKPALHKMYGTEQAVNVGDAAHIAMWKMLKDYLIQKGAEKGGILYDKFFEILNTTVEGQYLDINFTKKIKKIGDAGERMYLDIIERKTSCYSVYGPMQLGATVAGQGEKVMKGLKDIGSPAGMAFQIIDDLLDVTSDDEKFGKKKYGDLYEGKLTLIILHAYKSATSAEKARIDKIYAKDGKTKTKDEIAFLAEIIEKYQSTDHAYRLAMKYGEEAQAAIRENFKSFPDNEYKDLLVSAIAALFIRNR